MAGVLVGFRRTWTRVDGVVRGRWGWVVCMMAVMDDVLV